VRREVAHHEWTRRIGGSADVAARAIAGEYETALAAWVEELAARRVPVPAAERPVIHLQRGTFDPSPGCQVWAVRLGRPVSRSR
jgi:hypothetical protein